jgi:hypothetical protein
LLTILKERHARMRCEACGSAGDWLGDDAQWEPVSDGGAVVVVQVLECTECGHRQRKR